MACRWPCRHLLFVFRGLRCVLLLSVGWGFIDLILGINLSFIITSIVSYAKSCNLSTQQVSGSGLALARIPIEQDAAYWEWHVNLPGLPRAPSEDEDLEAVQMNGDDDPDAIKFGVATRKDRNFYKMLDSVEDEGGMFFPVVSLS